MNFAEYVITGWVLTGVVLGAYWLWIVQRTKRAERSPRTRVTTVASPPARAASEPRPKRRGRYIVAVGGCVVAVVAIIVLAVVLSENVVYFRTVSEAVQQPRGSEGTSRFRLAGGVVDGSIDETRERRALRGDRRQEHRRRPPRR